MSDQVNPSTIVSVIIPAWNAEQWISEAVESVLRQTWRNVDIIVVDDGSTDDTATIVERISDERVRCIRAEHRGAAAARNRGLEYARGELIQFLDADDILGERKLELQIEALSMSPSRSVASCAWALFLADISGARMIDEAVWAESDPIEWLRRSLSGEGMMQPAAWLVPRAVADAAGPWNESLSLHDDGEYFARVLVNASRNVFVQKAIVYYRSVPGSLSRQRTRAAIESAFAVCKGRHMALIGARDDAGTRQAIATQYAQFAYEFASSAPDLAAGAVREIRKLGARPSNAIGGRSFRNSVRVLGMEKALQLRSRLSSE
jgi:glycosyltransferase involved in cell wall biosynthesis